MEDEAGIPHFVTREYIAEIPVRMANRYTDEDWKKEASYECQTPFVINNDPLMRVVYLKSPTASDLIVVCHHCICDGRAIINLLDETLSLLGHPQKELASYESFSSLNDFIPESVRKSKLNLLMVFLAKNVVKLALLAASSKKEIKRVKPYLMHWKLDNEESALILDKCKKEGVSPNAVLAVIFLKAFNSVESIKSYNKLFCAVDMRTFLTSIKNDMLFAFPEMVGLSLKGGGAISFWNQVHLFRDELLLKINKTNVNKAFLLSEQLLPSLSRITKLARADSGAHDFTFSNIGKTCIKENYGVIEVEKLYSPVTIFPFGNPSTLIASTFRGQLDFIITSDEHFLTQANAVAVKEKAMGLLREVVSMPEAC
ncbi:hypothetical protein TH53_08480 [Pedobacter lusitanus]|uniref:Condensation domain-containing protein n=2 Tax=Pedobacter lusitanus TaxID=1503925 RepID=A0A0D0FYP0_9SPHI|nr:hypothetical protein [Pedobacter lusitanus]KIO77664.1 hypothetical protein TH53_08480 [Pedobacter lusitanus]